MVTLPPELLDTVLGFVKDSKSLQHCAIASTGLTTIAEQHLYKHVEIWPSQTTPKPDKGLQLSLPHFLGLSSKNPRSSAYIKSIRVIAMPAVLEKTAIVLPTLPSLVALCLYTPAGSGTPSWLYLDANICTLWLELIALQTVEEIGIQAIGDFPLMTLDRCHNIRRLNLIGICFVEQQSQLPPPQQQPPPCFLSNLHHLALHHIGTQTFKVVIAWLTASGSRMISLRSADLRVWDISHSMSLLEFLSPATLQELTIVIGGNDSKELTTTYTSIRSPVDSLSSTFEPADNDYTLPTLPSLSRLTKIAIFTVIGCTSFLQDTEDAQVNVCTYQSCIPTIVKFIQAVRTDTLREIVINVVMISSGPEPPTLSDIDFSPLNIVIPVQDSASSPMPCPSITLQVSGRKYDTLLGKSIPHGKLLELENNRTVAAMMQGGRLAVESASRAWWEHSL